MAASALGPTTGGTFFLPSKLQGYKRNHKNEEHAHLLTLNTGVRRKKEKRQERLSHFSKQVLRQMADP